MLNFNRNEFSLPEVKTYLNCAYMSPLANRVVEAGITGIRRKQDPFTISTDDFFNDVDHLRAAFAQLVSGRAGQVAVVASASYGLSAVAHNVRPRKNARIVVVEGEFPSNYYPWQKLGCRMVRVAPPKSWQDRGKIWNERLLETIKPGTAVVAIGNVHWADGTRFDLKQIRKAADRVGALLVIDGTQSVGALPISIKQIRPDALICAGYKWLMGPYGIGLAWMGNQFKDGKPLEENWISRKGSRNFTGLVDYEDDYQPGMARYDVGERSNFILVPMMLRALEMINEWNPQSIQDHCAGITRQFMETIRSAGWWVEDENWRAHHLFGIRPPHPQKAQRWKELLMNAGISVSFRGDFIRISPHLYNTESDFERLASVLTGR